ncbi:hypothetical protein ACXLRA_001714 [Vibrio vulnificus]|nr:hypothetical protein [Vibrio vulnificus]HDY7589857.1 hypothetical protein [Vibrio vulnificus]HDY8141471.1 hypothetical protein [Vibrio vulnificus]HDY8220422.1 hypothetical protein [Vibrio vulnificus]
MQLNTNFLIFYFPFLYFYKTRLKTPKKGLGWIFSYVLPIMIGTNSFSTDQFFFMLVLMLGIYSAYEYGYIYNDSVTIENEINPTMRLEYSQIEYARKNMNFILAFRGGVAIFVYCFFAIQYILVPFLILLTYFFYNRKRGRINLLLHFFLVLLRFSSIFLVVSGIGGFIYSILIFPLINLFERMSEKRFGFHVLMKFRQNISLTRVVYYFFVFLLSLLLDIQGWLFLATCYFLVFRLSVYFLGCIKIVSK